MRKLRMALAAASIFAMGLVAAPALYAQSGQAPSGAGRGMMGQDGMMSMMTQMGQMMDQCSKMMSSAAQGERQPHEQKKDAPPPAAPENKG